MVNMVGVALSDPKDFLGHPQMPANKGKMGGNINEEATDGVQ
jgi:hypothetical protein